LSGHEEKTHVMSELVQLESTIGRTGASAGSSPSEAALQYHHHDLSGSDPGGADSGRPKTGAKAYWRSLEELAQSDAFEDLLHREFPESASEFNDPVGRRRFLKLMGASLALAGVTACTRQPPEKIAPYVRQPEEIVPGHPLFFATAMPLCGIGTGLLVESHEGRPTKIEGNPDHPASLGASDIFAQASILGLYDPDRSQTMTYLGDISPWPAFLGALRPAMTAQKALKGAGLRILTGAVTSPTLHDQIKTLLTDLPEAKWHQWEPAGRDNVLEGSRLAFGEYLNPIYRIDKADVIVSLDSDFLTEGPGHLRYAREFVSRRKLDGAGTEINRLYAVESTPTATGAKADHRWPMKPSEIEAFAHALAAELGVPGFTAKPGAGTNAKAVKAIVDDLRSRRGSSLVIAGDYQPARVHAIAHSINQALGNAGNTVVYTEPVEADPAIGNESLRELAHDMKAGKVDLLVIIGCNPVYDAPADLDFAASMFKVGLRVHLGLYKDETGELCEWHIPEAHYLESWSDVRAFDGTASIIQPLIMPLYQGRTAHEIIAALSDQPERAGYDIVRAFWMKNRGRIQTAGDSSDFEKFWRKSLHDGLIASTQLPAKAASVKPDWSSKQALAESTLTSAALPSGPGSSETSFEIAFHPDPTVFDGRFSNNGWLQELPKPLSKITWDNAVLVSPGTAERLGLTNNIGGISGEVVVDMVRVLNQGRSIEAPALITPGQPDGSITVHLGYGRTSAGRAGSGAGFRAYAIRTSDSPWSGSGVELTKTGGRRSLAVTQLHHLLEGRDLVRSGSLEHYRNHPDLAPEGEHSEQSDLSLFERHEYKGYAWGMSIDLNSCVGCNACMVACQSENNIPVVGREEVLRGREMHWIRVDSYYAGEPANPRMHFQPVPCMQCENAPCELVCPVAATTHSAEGLNDMVYNRCVGTRYCSNNCPYKVRRFNFFLFQDWTNPTYQMMRNPDVTVRSRGVMEKCTYCVQRINRAKITAEKDNRQVGDGEIVTACEAACPAQAITFGNVNDPESRVSKLKAEPRNYGLLAELNTRPRTTYLGAVRNPNPELEKA
jgi:MoCo/4Fe-4S cofactor protein with predicted Tat translocation signal